LSKTGCCRGKTALPWAAAVNWPWHATSGLASDNAKIWTARSEPWPGARFGGTQRLMQLVGRGKAMEMMMTGNMISANEALFLGLVNHVVPAEDLLPQTVTF